MERRKLGFIGAGNLAAALIRGVLAKGSLGREDLRVSDPSEARRAFTASELGVLHVDDNAALADWADVVVLAVKPGGVEAALAEARGKLDAHKLLISVCAGVPTARLEQSLGEGARVIRAMPNTPALVSAGATAYAPGRHATDADAGFARELFRAVGECVAVEERLMDAVTGLSGSGPAYVLMLIEALADGGVEVGLPRDVAQRLALQTVLGTARLAAETGEHPALLKDRVTSPGGTTIHGIRALEAAGFRHALMSAVRAATQRSEELGQSAKK